MAQTQQRILQACNDTFARIGQCAVEIKKNVHTFVAVTKSEHLSVYHNTHANGASLYAIKAAFPIVRALFLPPGLLLSRVL